MQFIKLSLFTLLFVITTHAHALIIDYKVEGRISSLGGYSKIVGMSEDDEIYATWTVDTQMFTQQTILSTAPSTESGRPALLSSSFINGITNFSLYSTNSLITSSTNNSTSYLNIGENGAPPSDTQSVHDSAIRINKLNNEGLFTLVDLTGMCCDKSILIEDINKQPDLAAYILSDFKFGWGIINYRDSTMEWSAEYDFGSLVSEVRSYSVPSPTSISLFMLGLLFIKRQHSRG